MRAGVCTESSHIVVLPMSPETKIPSQESAEYLTAMILMSIASGVFSGCGHIRIRGRARH